MSRQTDWRFCQKCAGMFFGGIPSNGLCPAGGGHQAQGFTFTLPFHEPETGTAQVNWRFCDKCFAMFFDGAPNKGVCPGGNGHRAQGLVFSLPHDVPETEKDQGDWRFCEKCFGMHFARSAANACPAGGAHVAQGFPFVLPHGQSAHDVLRFDPGPITSDLAMGGSAQITVQRGGRFNFHSHVHESGATNIDYTLVAVLMPSSGQTFSFTHMGSVKGLFGNRNDDFDREEHNPDLALAFEDLAFESRIVGRLAGTDTLVAGIEGLLEDAAKQAAQELGKAAGAIIALI